MQELPQDYIIQTIYSYCKRPYYKKYQGVYNAECCICNEGASSGSKRRLFYFPSERYFYCFNCNRSWNELNWVSEVTGKQYFEILKESRQFDGVVVNTVSLLSSDTDTPKRGDIPPIPVDSVDIFDSQQCSYYEGSKNYKLIEKALEYCHERRLHTAINRPKSLFVSFEDRVHKNRLIIPFYSETGKIESYQSRSLFDDTYPKYLTKYGDKCLYGENTLSADIPYIFVFEGPIDAMFVKNGVAIGGATLTERQEQFLDKCFGQEVIFVYDNDKNNKEMEEKVQKLIKQNKKLFVWPKEFQKYKDINEVCCSLQLDEFPLKFILQNSFSGVEAQLKFKMR